jgi:pilus assembly protein CpaF
VIVQLSRFTEDGSRRITRVTEACGLEGDKYNFRDLFVLRQHGKTRAGRIVAELEPTGTQPTFAAEAHEQALGDRIKLTGALWKN